MFDDFGADICPVAEGTFLDSDVGFGNKNCWDFEKENLSGPRYILSTSLYQFGVSFSSTKESIFLVH